jgi:hypothetical protein
MSDIENGLNGFSERERIAGRAQGALRNLILHFLARHQTTPLTMRPDGPDRDGTK